LQFEASLFQTDLVFYIESFDLLETV